MNQPRNKTKSGLSRRTFIRGTATAIAGFTIVPRHVLGGAGFVPPSEKVNIAIVGCGGQGRTNVRALFQEADAQIIAVADPIESQNLDAFYYKGSAGRLPVKAEIEKYFAAKTPNYSVAAYEDFRVLLEKEKIFVSRDGVVENLRKPRRSSWVLRRFSRPPGEGEIRGCDSLCDARPSACLRENRIHGFLLLQEDAK